MLSCVDLINNYIRAAVPLYGNRVPGAWCNGVMVWEIMTEMTLIVLVPLAFGSQSDALSYIYLGGDGRK